jgi:hypothetical protein
VEDLNSDVVVDDITKAAPEGIHSGIGVVVPVSKIRETLMQDELEKARKKIIKDHLEKSSVTPDVATDDVDPAANSANPNHREDFNSLVGEAVRKRAPKD